jgi:hypothetical protein
VKITLPLPPNMANARRHWRVTLRDKKAYWLRCDIFAAPEWEDGEAWILRKGQRYSISATLYMPRAMDDDNALHRCKWSLDWLVANVYLPGDSRKHITWDGMPEQVIEREEPRVEFTIKPIAKEEAA